MSLYHDNSVKIATTSTGVNVTGTVEFDGLSGTGSVNVTDILDQDDMSSNSATALATQQSIKAYVDSQVATVDTLSEVLANGNTTGGTNIVFGDSSGASEIVWCLAQVLTYRFITMALIALLLTKVQAI